MDADGKNVEGLTDNPAWDGEPHWWGAPTAVEPAGKSARTWGKTKQNTVLPLRRSEGGFPSRE